MAKHGPKKTFSFTKEELEHEYHVNGKTILEIANMYGCGETTVHKNMKRLGVERRHRSELLKGRSFTKEHRESLSKSKLFNPKNQGENNPNWKGGVSSDNTIIRRRAQYSAFRARVLRWKGDNCYECGKNLHECCHSCGHKPDRHVHHLKGFAENGEQRHDFDNAVVLCEDCHRNLHYNRD